MGPKLRANLILLCAAALTVSGPVASATQPISKIQVQSAAWGTSNSDETPSPEVIDGGLTMISPADDSHTSTRVTNFQTKGDLVHRSGVYASGHGYWMNINTSATKATVKIKLQVYLNGAWRDKTSWQSGTWRSGGGKGNRTTAKYVCKGTGSYKWHSVVDVDLIGVIDGPDVLVTPTNTISCTP